MTIKEHWEESGLSQRDYCEKHGFAYARFLGWLRTGTGRRRPTTPEDIAGVAIATDGAVDIEDWLGDVLAAAYMQARSASILRAFEELADAEAG